MFFSHGLNSMDHSNARVERLYGIPITGYIGGITADPHKQTAYVSLTDQNVVLKVLYSTGRITRSARHDYPIFSSLNHSFEYYIRYLFRILVMLILLQN